MLQFTPETHQYTWNGKPVPSVTQILQVMGKYHDWNPDASEAARELGKAVHLATELYDNDDLDEESLDPQIRPYLDAWIKFKRDSGIVILANEQILYHPKYAYAGTLDRVGMLKKDRALVDIKTGLLYPTYGPQLSAYKNAWEIKTGMKINSRLAVQLRESGDYRLTPYVSPNDWPAFLACLSIHNFKEQTE